MKVNNIGFRGNYLIKFPSQKARDAAELDIKCKDKDRFLYCSKINKDNLHVLTGQDIRDWSAMVELSHSCFFTKWQGKLDDVINNYFLKNAVPLDFSKIKQDDEFLNACLNQLKKDKPNYEWLPEAVEEIIKE